MSCYIRKTSGGWAVTRQTWTNGKRKQVAVPASDWHVLGLSRSMSIEQARARVKQINAQNSLSKVQHLAAAAAHRQIQLINSIWLPQELASRFQEQLLLEYDPDGSRGLLWHWHTVQKLVVAAGLEPVAFAAHKQKLFAWMRQKRFSLDYSKKLLRVLNLFGAFACEERGQFYKQVQLTAVEAQRLRDGHLDAGGGQESEALTPEQVMGLAGQLKAEQVAWLEFAVWFGLRPKEVDGLGGPEGGKWRVEREGEVAVLCVYQPKLVAVAREQRWKYIPAFLPEQQKLVAKLKAGVELKRPLNKVLKRLLGKQITCYGGRKGFIDLMLDRGQKLEDVSAWLGHNSIEMSWKRYRNRKRVSFTKAG